MTDRVLFGRYRLVEPAGRGGTAEVWRAHDERTGEEVAVKRLHPIVFASDEGRERLVREFRALRDLRHPNVVTVRDLEIERDEAAIVLDFIPGMSLRERLAAGPPLTADQAVGVAADIGDALRAAHDAGLVHRDVSPGNVLLGRDGVARLTDFGIARAATDDTAVTATGQVVGTLRYIAPEQLRGEPATPAGDLFGLAAVTYEMLAGRAAFDATTPVGLVEAHRAGPAPIYGVAARLDSAVRRALAAEPTARHGSIAEFLAELGVRTADEVDTVTVPAMGPVAAPAVPEAADAERSGRKAAWPVALGAAAILGALALGAAALGDRGTHGTAVDPTAVPAPATERPAPTQAVDERDDEGGGGDDDEGRGRGNGNEGGGNGNEGGGNGNGGRGNGNGDG